MYLLILVPSTCAHTPAHTPLKKYDPDYDDKIIVLSLYKLETFKMDVNNVSLPTKPDAASSIYRYSVVLDISVFIYFPVYLCYILTIRYSMSTVLKTLGMYSVHCMAD